MDDFNDIRIRDLVFYSRLSALGSITAAARELGVPKGTASRWLSKLEERVGESLVKRTTRSVALTERGKAFEAGVREILSAVQSARLAVQSEAPGGTLRVSVPVPMGRMLSGPVIAEFRRRLPGVRLEIRMENARVDLIRDGLDLAVRGGPLPDSDMLARRLSSVSMWLYASARFRDAQASEIPLIASPGDAQLLRRSPVAFEQGEPAVVVDDRTAVADALAWGAGAGLLPSFLGEPLREEGAIVRLDETAVASLPVHAIYHSASREDPRLHVLIDEIARQLERVF